MNEPRFISREGARLRGLVRFFIGTQCPRGHVVERYTSNGSCVSCVKLAEKRMKAHDPQRKLEQSKTNYQANKEKINQRAREWVKKNKERAKHMNRIWLENNPEKPRQYTKKWELANRESMRARAHNRRAKILAAPGRVTGKDFREIVRSQGNQCAFAKYEFEWCKSEFGKGNKPHMDHIHPISKGGTNYPHNFQALCSECNIRKHNHDQTEFLRRKGVQPMAAIIAYGHVRATV